MVPSIVMATGACQWVKTLSNWKFSITTACIASFVSDGNTFYQTACFFCKINSIKEVILTKHVHWLCRTLCRQPGEVIYKTIASVPLEKRKNLVDDSLSWFGIPILVLNTQNSTTCGKRWSTRWLQIVSLGRPSWETATRMNGADSTYSRWMLFQVQIGKLVKLL